MQAALLGNGAAVVAAVGWAGVGKTALAVAVAHDALVRRRFPDGIFLLRVTHRAANAGVPRGVHGTPSHPVEDPSDPLQIGKVPSETPLH